MSWMNNKAKNAQHTNEKLAQEYQLLIETDLPKFVEMLDNAQVDLNNLTPQQRQIVKKYRSALTRKSTISTCKALWHYMMIYKPAIAFVFLVTLISIIFNCLASFSMVYLTNSLSKLGVDMSPPPNGAGITNPIASPWFSTFSIIAAIILVFYFIYSFGLWLQTRIMAIVSQRVGYKIRENLFDKIQKLPVKYFDQNSSGDLMSKFTNDVNNITDMFSQNSAIILNGLVTFLAMFISMLLLSPYLTLVLIAFLPIMLIPAVFLSKKSQPLFANSQKTLGEVNGYIEEMISGQSVITLYDQNQQVLAEFNKINKNLTYMTFRGLSVTSVIMPYFVMFLNLITVMVWVAGLTFSIKKVGPGFEGISLINIAGILSNNVSGVSGIDVQVLTGISLTAAFSTLARNFMLPFTQISGIINTLMMAMAGADRAFKVFEEPEEINECERLILNIVDIMLDNTSTPSLQEEESIKVEVNGKLQKINDLPHTVETNSSIKVQDLNFGYYDFKQILFDINIDVKKGQTIAIVGPTGSGKSTFINLLTKFYDIKQGDILFGNRISLKDITKESIRNNVSIVLQDTFLFNESIKDNIRYGNMDASDEQVIKAAQVANAHNFIMQLPNGYDTVLNDNGEDLSQGQRQLLAISRAILSPSNLLILDEATSSIDTKTELEIQSAMMRLMENKTSFVIAHRLSTIQNANQILVLKDGHIIERGTHAELLEMQGFYYELYNSQFYEEE